MWGHHIWFKNILLLLFSPTQFVSSYESGYQNMRLNKENKQKKRVQKQKEKHGTKEKRISPSQVHQSSQGEQDRTTTD